MNRIVKDEITTDEEYVPINDSRNKSESFNSEIHGSEIENEKKKYTKSAKPMSSLLKCSFVVKSSTPMMSTRHDTYQQPILDSKIATIDINPKIKK